MVIVCLLFKKTLSLLCYTFNVQSKILQGVEMKFAKLSLATVVAMGIGTGAMALDLSKATIKPYVNTKLYYETVDHDYPDAPDLFNQDASSGQALVQVGASGKLNGCWGYGLEYSVADTLGLENDVVAGMVQSMYKGDLTSAGITQAYLTYGIGNTSVKVGRQALPKALSPFAFSEGWNVFKNSFEAALIVNTDITDTTLVGAYVWRSNSSLGNLNDFTDLSVLDKGAPGVAVADNGVYMLTAQNKSIDKLTLTGTWYIAPEMVLGLDDANVLWADAKYGFGEDMYGLVLGVQGGTVMLDTDGLDDTTAWGAKIGGNFDLFDASIAYSSVDDGTVSIENFGTNVKTPLYTQMIFNQNTIKRDSDTVVVRAGIKGLGGKFGIAYAYSDLGATALGAVTGKAGGEGEYSELDITYKVKVWNDSTTLFAGYVYQDDDRMDGFTISDDEGNVVSTFDGSQNMLRFWGRYNF
jgi:hypothetical protein